MKIKTKEVLIDLLNEDLAWRKKELTNLRNNIRTSPEKRLPTNLRAGTVLLYAHWEGFIKKAAESYLIYVSGKRLRLNELSGCFLALAVKQKMDEFETTLKSTKHSKFLTFILGSLNERANIVVTANSIRTYSNLNFSNLIEVLTTIGIDCRSFELKKQLIDSQLLNYRNNIAHGQVLDLDKEEFDRIHSEVTNMINEINNRIQNAAVKEEYKS